MAFDSILQHVSNADEGFHRLPIPTAVPNSKFCPRCKDYSRDHRCIRAVDSHQRVFKLSTCEFFLGHVGSRTLYSKRVLVVLQCCDEYPNRSLCLGATYSCAVTSPATTSAKDRSDIHLCNWRIVSLSQPSLESSHVVQNGLG